MLSKENTGEMSTIEEALLVEMIRANHEPSYGFEFGALRSHESHPFVVLAFVFWTYEHRNSSVFIWGITASLDDTSTAWHSLQGFARIIIASFAVFSQHICVGN